VPHLAQIEGAREDFRRLPRLGQNFILRFGVEPAHAEIFGFLGPNGAGKTTTVRMLATLASITSGHCSVVGLGTSISLEWSGGSVERCGQILTRPLIEFLDSCGGIVEVV